MKTWKPRADKVRLVVIKSISALMVLAGTFAGLPSAFAVTPIAQLAGNGKQVTRQVSLPAGVYVFRIQHSGRSNFIVRPLSTDGRKYAPLVNEIGKFSGSAVFVVDAERSYLFNVDGDGQWRISVENPRPSLDNDKTQIKGRGQQATDVFTFEGGLYVFEMKHNGKSNFIVHPVGLSGRRLAPLVNEIGRFDGSAAETLERGEYLFQIAADGDWEVLITKQ